MRHEARALMVVALTLAATACGSPEPDTPSEREAPVLLSMETEQGTMVLELYPERAPVTVANFLRYVDESRFTDGRFHRVVTLDNDRGDPKIEVIQAGLAPDREPFPPIEHESTDQTGLSHVAGAVSMARLEVGTASSEFFICIADAPGLDHGQLRNPDGQGFAVFGRVVEGMDVARAIQQLPADAPSEDEYTKGQILTTPVRILEVRRGD